MTETVDQLKAKARYIRNEVLEMCCGAQTGHVSSSFSCTEILVALYYGGILRYRPDEPRWGGRDRFILSKGQASVILYPILADLGFFPRNHLETFCRADGKFGVHLQHDVPGVEITSGSLGQGFGIATGMAKAAKMNRSLWLTVALLGDGECYEGSIWEAAMFAAHSQLNNLVAIIDRNFLCATNFTEDSLALEPLDAKWQAFGWDVVCIDGHDFKQMFEALKDVRSRKSRRPLAIIAETVKGKGVDFICYEPLWHALAPKGDDVEKARNQLKEALA